MEVFGRPATYDPKIDSVVRVEVSKLRARLDQYYETSHDELRISIRKGGYGVQLERNGFKDGQPSAAARTATNQWRASALIIAAGLALIVLGLWLRSTRLHSAPPLQPVIAVLPFADLSPTADQKSLADGFTEEITAEINRSAGIHVVARSSSAQYAGADVRRIGRELSVHAALEGSIRRIGDRVKVTAQLVESRHGLQLMNSGYERDLSDVLGAQREIARLLALDFRKVLITVRRVVVRADWQQSEAYRPYLQAIWHTAEDSPDEMRQAIRLMRQALAADNNFALAWAGLARQQVAIAEQDAAPIPPACEEARTASDRALALDPRLVEGYLARGWYRAMCAWNWTGAEADFQKASELDPAYLLSQYDFGRLLNMVGKPNEAARVFKQALDADPTWTWLLNGLGSALIKAERYDEALKPIEESMRIRRGAGVCMYRGMLAAEQGKHHEAIDWFRQGLELSPNSPTISGRMGYSLAKLGRGEESRALIRTMAESTERQVPELEIAAIHAGLGDNDEAMNWLDKAYNRRSFTISYSKVDYRFRDVRNNPRFQDLLRKLHLDR